jgi:hypothetical protein
LTRTIPHWWSSIGRLLAGSVVRNLILKKWSPLTGWDRVVVISIRVRWWRNVPAAGPAPVVSPVDAVACWPTVTVFVKSLSVLRRPVRR